MANEIPDLTPRARPKENAWTDLGLTLPIFIGYHLGVVFLPVQNAADLLTHKLRELSEHSMFGYWLLTLTIGAVFVTIQVLLGRGQSLRWQRFVGVILEGAVYAVALRVIAGAVVGRLHLASGSSLGLGPTAGLVMSFGAGFYEEIVFRVGIFALLGRLVWLLVVGAPSTFKRVMFWLGWALFSSALFSAWHHVGDLGEPFTLSAFVFRWVSGLVFTTIFTWRGFAPVVFTHTLYDVWVLVL